VFVHLHCHSHYSVSARRSVAGRNHRRRCRAENACRSADGLETADAAVRFTRAAKKPASNHRGVCWMSNGIMEQVLPRFRAQRDRFLSARLLAQRDLSASCSPLATRHSMCSSDGHGGLQPIFANRTLRLSAQQIVTKHECRRGTDGRPVTLQECGAQSRRNRVVSSH